MPWGQAHQTIRFTCKQQFWVSTQSKHRARASSCWVSKQASQSYFNAKIPQNFFCFFSQIHPAQECKKSSIAATTTWALEEGSIAMYNVSLALLSLISFPFTIFYMMNLVVAPILKWALPMWWFTCPSQTDFLNTLCTFLPYLSWLDLIRSEHS